MDKKIKGRGSRGSGMLLMANMERTHVLDVFHHDEATVRQGLQMDVGQFDCSDQKQTRIGTKQLIVFGTDDHG